MPRPIWHTFSFLALLRQPTRHRTANLTRVVVCHIERKARARRIEPVLTADGQREFRLVARKAERQKQLDTPVVVLRYRNGVIRSRAALGLRNGTLKGPTQQALVSLATKLLRNTSQVVLIAQNMIDIRTNPQVKVVNEVCGVIGVMNAGRELFNL